MKLNRQFILTVCAIILVCVLGLMSKSTPATAQVTATTATAQIHLVREVVLAANVAKLFSNTTLPAYAIEVENRTSGTVTLFCLQADGNFIDGKTRANVIAGLTPVGIHDYSIPAGQAIVISSWPKYPGVTSPAQITPLNLTTWAAVSTAAGSIVVKNPVDLSFPLP
jgi:hypothetical protein